MKAFWIALVTVVVSAGPASAGSGSLNLGWTDCGGYPSTLNRSFACNTNSGTFTLVGSFVAPSSVIAASGIVSILDMQTTGVSLSPWWGMTTGLCRAGSLTANFDFTNGPWTCIDYWQGGASGAVTMDPPLGNRARIRVVAALPAGSPLITSMPEGDEVYAFKVVIDAARTTGLGACAGCQREAVICLTSVTITQPAGAAGGNRYVWQPASRSYATWQGGEFLTNYCFPDPVRNTTWGSIKTLYR